jgi:flavin-dependent dehydrogenase
MHDVLVVGAGPAGATAAKLLADAGHSVQVLEAVKPSEKACGGWLSKLAGTMFPWVERNATSLTDTPFAGLAFHSPDLKQTAEFHEKSTSGWLVDRAVFDAGLGKLATASGAAISYKSRVAKLAAGEEDVRVVTEDGREHAGKVLLAADGAEGKIAEISFRNRTPPPVMIGIGVHVKSKAPKLEKLFGKNRPLHLALAWGGLNGYGYVYARKTAVSFGLLARNLTAAEAPARLKAFAEQMTAAGLLPDEAVPAPAGMIRRVPAGAALESDDQVGKRVLFLGDAGGFAGAVVGEGIFPAMWSARLAAETVIDAFKAPKFQDALSGYKRRWRTEMAEHLRMPNTNMSFLLPLIFSNQQMTDRFAKAVLYGKNI